MRDGIHTVRLTRARGRTDGLIGFLHFEDGYYRFDSIALRKTANGSYSLSFPERTDQFGRAHPYVRPVNQVARAAVTRQVLAELRRRGEIP